MTHSPTSHRRLLLTLAALIAMVLTALVLYPKPADIPSLRSLAEQQLRQRRYPESLHTANEILAQLPNDPESLWIAARCQLALKQYRSAADLFLAIPKDSSHALPAALQAADILHKRLAILSPAESAWRKALELDPTHPAALTGLAQLLAFAGRRSEAVPLILQLVQLNQPSDLLIVLARPSGALHDEQLLQQATLADPDDPNLLLAQARLAEQNNNPQAAAELCRSILKSNPDFLPAHIQLGLAILLLNDRDQITNWERNLPDKLHDHPEIIRTRALARLLNGQPQQALPLLIQAARLHPEQRDLLWQLSRLLRIANDPTAAERCERYLEADRLLQEAQDRVLFAQDSQPADAVTLVNACVNCGRIIEAAGWAELARRRFPNSTDIERLAKKLLPDAQNAPLQLVQNHANPALSINHQTPQISNLNTNPSPTLPTAGSQQHTPPAATNFSFTPLDQRSGFNFSFINGSLNSPSRHMYELTGGGVAAADLDHDGWIDILCTQGGTWQNDRKSSTEPILNAFRNLRGKNFTNVTDSAGITAPDFGQGIAAGDLNQDGFTDVVAASTHGARLFINQGDGTLEDQGLLPESAGKWITSCAIADLNCDSFPDVFLVAYLGGSDVFSKLCDDGTGLPAMCLPAIFPAVPDLLLLSDHSGKFKDHSNLLPPSNDHGKGLGILVLPPPNTSSPHAPAPHPRILVANDTTPNALLTWDPAAGTWTDQGFASGLAVSSLGRAEGSMGIAAADLNADQVPEIVITNFLGESHAYYESQPGATWDDLRGISRLELATRDVLGFGTCFLDVQLDGTPELFIANGHIDNLQHLGKPWKMPAQLFTTEQGRFTLSIPKQPASWFLRPHIARAATAFDWNRDHAPDLLVALLHEPSTLLTNTSSTIGHAISLTLISTHSDRFAVGAQSTIINSNNLPIGPTQQILAGHGYQTAADNTLIHGCNSVHSLPTLKITWPTITSTRNPEAEPQPVTSPNMQMFHNLPANHHYIIIQNRPIAYAAPQ